MSYFQIRASIIVHPLLRCKMAKKSFIVYLDSLDVLDELTNDQAGQLLKAMRDYNKSAEVNLPGLLKAVFIPFKNQFDRDAEKYEGIVLRNRENGKSGGRPKETQQNPVGSSGGEANPKKPDNDNDSDNDSKKDSDNTPLIPQGGIENNPEQKTKGHPDSTPPEKPKRKERKGSAEKKESFVPPTKREWADYFNEKGITDTALMKRAYDHYTANDWKDSQGRQVVSWKQKVLTNWINPHLEKVAQETKAAQSPKRLVLNIPKKSTYDESIQGPRE